jgi:hypothetical protein
VLFTLCENKEISVAQALHGVPILFRRWLHYELRIQWEKIWENAISFQLDDNPDTVVWNLGKNKKFLLNLCTMGSPKMRMGFIIKGSRKERF